MLKMNISFFDFWDLDIIQKQDRTIRSFQILEEKIKKKSRKLTNIVKRFYEYLYFSKKIDEQFANNLLKNLSKKNFEKFRKRFIQKKIELVINKWENDTVLESDEIFYNFYKEYVTKSLKDEILLNLLTVTMISLNYNDLKVNISKKWKKNIIKVMYKNDDRIDIRNYRSLFMINFIFKLLTNIVNNRLINFMCECIEEQQRGFMFHKIYFDNIKNA